MASTQTPEQRELSLVGKVEMRIALTDSDAKLETTLKTYLAPLLLKLASEHQSVRNKVISVCQHVNTRVKPQSIQLPVPDLVKQFKAQENQLVRHFDLLYIQQGVGRLSSGEKAELLPVVVKGIASSGSHGARIFNLFLRLLEFFTLPPRGSKDDLELRERFGLSSADTEFLASNIGRLLLFVPQKGTSTTCPGVTQEEYASLNLHGKDDVWNPSAGGLNLQRTKVLAARTLASGIFNDQERFLPGLFASSDTSSNISDVGDDILKRSTPAIDLENEALIQNLYDLYFGTESRPRVRAPLRLKILGLLNKSMRSTTFANKISKLVDDGISVPTLDGEDTVMSNGTRYPLTLNGAPSIGREAVKLRSAIFTYVNFVARHGASETLHSIANGVISRLRDFIDHQGWPKVGPNEDLVSRGYAYEVVGLLAKAGPKSLLVEDEQRTLDLLRWMFTSLAKDSSGSSIVVSIEESLSTLLSAFARLKLDANEQAVLEDLLIDQMEQSADLAGNQRIRSTRYVVVRFANRCLPYASVKARWIDVLGLGATTDRAEVREEAERGLSPYWYRMLNGSTGVQDPGMPSLPSFPSVVDHFFGGRTTERSAEPAAVARYAHKAYAQSFQHLTSFARHMLLAEALEHAGVAVNADSEWERKLDVAVETDPKAREAVLSYVQKSTSAYGSQLAILLYALFESLIGTVVDADNHLIEFLALAPDILVKTLVPSTHLLLPILKTNNSNRRAAAAQTYGILSSYPDSDASSRQKETQQLQDVIGGWSAAVGAASSHVHGALLALGYYFSRCSYRKREVSPAAQSQLLTTLLEVISDSRDNMLKNASYTALGQLCMYDCVNVEAIEEKSKLRALIDTLYKTAKEGNEAAILCMGQLSMVLPEEGSEGSNLSYLVEQLRRLHEIKQAEVHFTVGEALSYVATGWESGALATKLDIEGPRPSSSQRTSTLSKLIDQTLNDCANTKPALKKAAVIWLLCLVQFCGEEKEVQSRLPACQAAFKRCLSDRDELVQETASRGLGLVYEKGDRSLKDDLVRDLVSSFSSDKQSGLAGNVSADTQLFEPGALPTGDGSVSTYKDIMSLASEVGDSSLVYRFMSMASSNAIWSSRAAFGRFGLSNVLSDSSVDGYLANNPKLYPKLFRYRFDPNGGVQRSMNDIWNALVKDSSATIDAHFDAIMEDLLTSILGKEWRVRQGSCAAIADLVSGRPLDKYEQYLERIWGQCFKVLDDIKESVRAAAASLARTLTGVLTRALEADHSSTKNASAMLKHVLPFLLSPQGMESSAKEVQAFAVHTLLEIIKKSNGSTLRPFIPDLVERLIGLLSSLEPEAVNYVHLNASKYNLTEQKIDDMRLSSVRSSPLMEAIERCLDLLDEPTMHALQPRLESAMKSAVGLPSKVGSSRVLVSLSTRRPYLFRAFADDYLKVIEKLVIDRNETVASSYAMAAGYVARSASDKQILRTVNFAKRLYFESEGDREATVPRRSITSGEIMFALSKHASDRFNSLASSVLPFVYVGRHDSNEQVKEQFQNTWNESVGGSRAVLLFLAEILELCTKHLDSPQWVLKHTSARTVADAVTAVSTLEAKMSEKVGEQLWPALEKALGGKTWEGKEVVLGAFVKFVETGQAFYVQRAAVKDGIIKIAVREAKRQNAVYKPHSIQALGQVAQARSDIDMSDTIFDIVGPLLESEVDDEDAMEIDGGQAKKAGDLLMAAHVAAINALCAGVNPALSQDDAVGKKLQKAFDIAARVIATPADVRRALFDSVAKVFGRIREAGKGADIDMDVTSLKTILFGPNVDIEALRLLRADALLAIRKAAPGVIAKMRGEVEEIREKEVSGAVRERLGKATAEE
ncbi:proteasome component M29 [Saxophila tyrrhenica]|uniref:Proteasome component M29 n=1 Tax=Saxophila tyrrhenica TaxID=1690608 RepID=A0AAV9PKC8_9PEZI|nr:proteasome component M29 [Saxophila tyrrhenica]